MTESHNYIMLSDKPLKDMITEAAFLVVNQFLKEFSQSRNKWYKDKRLFHFNWPDFKNENQTSEKFNYLIIANYLRKTHAFNPADLNLPELECFWLDKSLDIRIDAHMTDNNESIGFVSGFPQQQFGPNYPIRPSLHREGYLYTTFQPQLLNRIISQRKRLIESSSFANEADWIFDLRTLISDTISLLDITLNQFYIKAEYDPLPTWKFEKEILGERQGKALNDKLNWIFQVTGKHLNIQPEMPSLNNLRKLRNHLMHFDPPSLIVTFEEATIWLNQIIDIGKILIKVRKAINVEINTGLINFILQKEALFQPLDRNKTRILIGRSSDEDYLSTTWKD